MSSYDQLSPEQLMHISLAALDFINSKRQAPKSEHIGTGHWQDFHEQKKQRIRKFYEAGKTDSLRRVWKKILEEEGCQWYPDFDAFVKEQTGYTINTQDRLWTDRAARISEEISFYSKGILEVFSPDRCCCARTHEAGLDEDSADTSIDVSFSKAGKLVGGTGFCTIYGTDIDLQLVWKDNHTLQIIHPADAIFNSQRTVISFGEHILQILYTAR
jgi:hypothetical protein